MVKSKEINNILKNKTIYSLIFFSFVTICLSFLFATNSQFNVIEANAATDSSYAFSPVFIDGKTTCEKINASSYQYYSADCWHGLNGAYNSWFTSSDPDYIALAKDYNSRITSTNKNSGIGIRYNNVGWYNGRVIDLTMTATVEILASGQGNSDTGSSKGEPNYAFLSFSTNKIGMHAHGRAMGLTHVTCKYYYHDTGAEATDMKAHFALVDIDPLEEVYLDSGYVSSLIMKGSHLVQSSNTSIYSGQTLGGYYAEQSCSHGTNTTSSVGEATSEHWLNVCTSGSTFKYTFGHTYDKNLGYQKKNRPIYYVGLHGDASAQPFDTPGLTKLTTATKITLGSGYQYKFRFTLPVQPSANPYTSLAIKDTLSNALKLTNGTFTVTDNVGNDVSNKFTLSSSGQLVTLTCNNATWLKTTSTGNKTYTVVINVMPKTDYTFVPASNGVIIPNTATITTNYGTKTSNTVNVEVVFKIDTKLTGKGTITGVSGSTGGSGSISNLTGGSSNTVSWSAATGYYVSSVKIDGVAQTISNTSSGSYTFNNIAANHTVEVVTSEIKHKVTTKLTGKGTITGVTGSDGGSGSITNISYGANQTVSWTAADGYYVSSVKVDGVAQTISNTSSGSYTFSNMTADHSVEVVTESASYKIDTKLIGKGTITAVTGSNGGSGSITNISRGANQSISWTAADGYIIRWLYIDGVAQAVGVNATSGSYTFNNIEADHKVEVYTIERSYYITFDVQGEGTVYFNDFVTQSMDGSAKFFKSAPLQRGTNHTVSWSAADGHYVSRLSVDGIVQTINDISGGLQTFDNIEDDHNVSIFISKIKYKIDIKLTGKGTITGVTGSDGGTGTISEVDYNSSETITWVAAEGYYVTSIKIDGVEQEINTYLTNGSKMFSNITANHSVEVITEPRPEFIITKTVDKSYYNANDIVDFTISFKLKDNTAPKAYNVVLEDIDMTEGVTLISNSITVNGVDSPRYTLANNGVFKLSMPYIDKDETVTINFKGKLENSYVNSLNENITNNMTNTARVTSDGIITSGNDETWESATVTAPVLKPIVSIIKNSDKEKYNVGDTVTYQITVNQTKENAIAHNVVVSDKDYTNGIKMTLNSKNDIQVTNAQGIALDSSLYNVSITNNESFGVMITRLEYNQPVIISVKGVLTDSNLSGKDIQNKAEATCDNNTKTVSSIANSVVLRPNLEIEKIAEKNIYKNDDIVKYTIKINQTVDGASANLANVTDTVPAGMQLDKSSIKIYNNSISESNLMNSGYILIDDENKIDVTFDKIIKTMYIVYSTKVSDINVTGKDITNTAYAKASNWLEENNSGEPENVVVFDSSTITIAKPEFIIEKSADKSQYNVGDTIKYSVSVKQTNSNAIAKNVIITDTIATDGVKFVTTSALKVVANGSTLTETNSTDVNFVNGDYYVSKFDEKSFGIVLKKMDSEKISISVDALVESSSLAGKSIINTASVGASNYFDFSTTGEIVNKTKDVRNMVNVLYPNMSITKTSDKTQYNIGDTIKYTVNIKQSLSQALAKDVVITDTLPNGVTLNENSFVFSNGDIVNLNVSDNKKSFTIRLTDDLSDSFSFTYSVVVLDNALMDTRIINNVKVDWSNNPDNKEAKDDAVSEVLKPVLSIQKTTNKEVCNLHDVIDYSIVVKQTAENARASNLVVSDTLPNGVSLIESSITTSLPTSIEIAQDKKSFKVSLESSFSDTLKIDYKVNVTDSSLLGKTITNTATVDWLNRLPAEDIPTAKASNKILKPEIKIEKKADKPYYNIGDVVTYNVNVTQTTNGAKAYNVVVTDELPSGLELVSENDVTISAPATFSVSDDNNSFTIRLTNPLENEFAITYLCKATNSIASNTLVNVVKADWEKDPESDIVEDTESSEIIYPNIEVSKKSDKEFYNVGDEIKYTVEVKQTVENARANDVVVTDVVPNGLKINESSIQLSANADISYNKDNRTITVALKQGLTDSFTITYFAIIESNNLAGENIVNTAIADWSNNPNSDKPEGKSTDPVLLPKIEINKSSDKEFYNVGDEIKYTVEVKQTAENARANDVVITDTLPIGASLKANSVNVSVPATVKIIDNGRSFTVALDNGLSNSVIITYSCSIDEKNLAGTNITNIASVNWSNNPNGDKPESKTVDTVLLPRLQVNKTSDKDYYNVGNEINYTVEVKQTTENACANDVIVTDVVPNGLKINESSIQSSANADISYNKDNRTITVALKQGLTDSFTITYTGIIENANLAGKNIVNTAIADWSNNPNNDKPEGKSTDSVLLPKLKVEKNADKSYYNVKDTINYTIKVSQLTANAHANNVIVTDVVPNGLKLNESSIQSSANANISYNENSRTITVALKQGLTNSFTIAYSAIIENDNLAGKNIVNTAVVDWSNNPNNDKPEGKSTVPILLPVLTITKNSGKNGTTYNVKDTLPFEVIVKQTTKNAVANDVVVSDRMAIADIDVNIDSVKVYNANGDLLVKDTDYTLINQYDETTHKSGFDIKLASLSNQIRFTYDAIINNNYVAGKSVSNHVVVTASNNQGEKPTARSEDSIPEPVLTIEKKADRNYYNVGDNAKFTIVITQTTKDARANDVVITDELQQNGFEINYDTVKVSFNENELESEINKIENGFVVAVGNITDKDTVVITYEGKVTSNALSGNDFLNRASAVWSNDPDYPTGTETISESSVLKPELTVKKTIDNNINNRSFNVGDIVNYTITVSIDSEKTPEARANNVVITDNMYEDGVIIDFDSIYIDEYARDQYNLSKQENGFVIDNIPHINDGEIITIHYQAKVVDPSLVEKDFNNTATATCDNNPEIVEDDANGSIVTPKLEILKDIEFENYNLSDVVNYTITVNQLAPQARANDVVITDIFDTDGIEIIPESIELVSGSDITVLPVSDSDLTIVSDSDLASASANGFVVKTSTVEKSFVVKYQAKIVDKNLMGQSVTNKAYVTSSNYLDKDNKPIVKKASITANVYEPVLSIEKTSDRYTYNLYDIVHFNVKVTQTVENAIARGVVINDSFINQGIEIDPKTIVVKNFLPEDYEITQTGNGYEIAFNVPILYNQLIEIEYDAKITDPSLVDCILEHDVYTSCVTNINTTGIWNDKVTIEVLKSNIIITKTSDKTEAYDNEIVKYTVTVSQIVKNANSFNLIINDVIENNMLIDTKSIEVSSSDITFDISKVEVVEKDNGFVANIPYIKGENSVTFTYNAKVIDETNDTSTNIVSVSGETLKDGIEAKATINILKTPVTGEINTLPIVISIMLISVGLFVGVAYLRRKQYVSLNT